MLNAERSVTVHVSKSSPEHFIYVTDCGIYTRSITARIAAIEFRARIRALFKAFDFEFLFAYSLQSKLTIVVPRGPSVVVWIIICRLT